MGAGDPAGDYDRGSSREALVRPFSVCCVVVWCAGILDAQSGWIQRLPLNTPTARNSQLLVYDMVRGLTVMYGGWPSFADTWEWNGSDWSQRFPAHSPPGRSSAAFGYDLIRGRIVLFGGVTGRTTLDDTWEFDGSDWIAMNPTTRPPARLLSGMALDIGRASMVMFGGGGSVNGPPGFGDTWEWNGSSWRQLQTPNQPSPRWAFGMAADIAQGRIILQGGATVGSNAPTPDTWIWSGGNWSPGPTTTTPGPEVATGFAQDWVHSVTVRFGGTMPMTDTCWLMTSTGWIRDNRTLRPSSRSNNSCEFDLARGRVVMFGGWTGTASLADTWEYIVPPSSSWQPYGQGCSGTAGSPFLQPQTGSVPSIGATFRVDLTSIPTTAVSVFAVGFSDTAWTGGSLPMALDALGMPGCVLLASPDQLFFATANSGVAQLSLVVPNDANLVGLQFFMQAMASDAAANAFGAVLSNAGAGTLGLF